MASETDILTKLRKSYRAEGYDVDIRPRVDLPDGTDLSPDLLARKADRTVLVGIRALGAGAAGSDRLRRLAEAAKARDDWSFRLVLSEPEGPAPGLPALDIIRGRLSEARRLHRKGDHVPAMLYAWALFTGAARRRLGGDEAGLAFTDPLVIVKHLAAEGGIDQQDLAWLERAAHHVAALQEGQVTLPTDSDLFDRVCALAMTLCRRGRDVDAPDLSA